LDDPERFRIRAVIPEFSSRVNSHQKKSPPTKFGRPFLSLIIDVNWVDTTVLI
jgi:hypothetical protein